LHCKTTEPNGTNFYRDGLLEEEFQICTNEVDSPLGEGGRGG